MTAELYCISSSVWLHIPLASCHLCRLLSWADHNPHIYIWANKLFLHERLRCGIIGGSSCSSSCWWTCALVNVIGLIKISQHAASVGRYHSCRWLKLGWNSHSQIISLADLSLCLLSLRYWKISILVWFGDTLGYRGNSKQKYNRSREELLYQFTVQSNKTHIAVMCLSNVLRMHFDEWLRSDTLCFLRLLDNKKNNLTFNVKQQRRKCSLCSNLVQLCRGSEQ